MSDEALEPGSTSEGDKHFQSVYETPVSILLLHKELHCGEDEPEVGCLQVSAVHVTTERSA